MEHASDILIVLAASATACAIWAYRVTMARCGDYWGFLAGMFFGPFGVIIAYLMPLSPDREAMRQAKIERELVRARALLERDAAAIEHREAANSEYRRAKDRGSQAPPAPVAHGLTFPDRDQDQAAFDSFRQQQRAG